MNRALTRAERLNRLEVLLASSPDGVTITDIAEEMGVHRTTIWRDLNTLEARVPIIQQGDRYCVDRREYLSSIRLSPEESLMLYLSMRIMIRRLTHIPPAMLSAMDKLTLPLRHPVTDQLAVSLQNLRQDRLVDPDRVSVWEILLRGWFDQVAVRFSYKKFHAEEVTEYELEPYLFEPAVLSEGIYVIGHSVTHDALRTFKVERILHATLTTRSFEPQDEISADDLLRHAWGIWYGEDLIQVTLRFADAAVAGRVRETLWHPSQELEELPGGGVLWRVNIAGLQELIPWIRGWGPACEVLEPASLRDQIARELREAAALYE